MTSIRMAVLILGQISPAQFHAYWSKDGAELDGYRLSQPRYGESRRGEAVMIWVTEPFSVKKHVKLDAPDAADPDAQNVLKLNLVRKFVTGVYDYSLMTSVFSPIVFAPSSFTAESPLKISFTSQEWCGNVFQQLLRTQDAFESSSFSYFEAEGDRSERFPLSERLLTEDELWFRVREILRPLPAGEYRFLPGLQSHRLSHTPMVEGKIALSRSTEPEGIATPAGTFQVFRWTIDQSWGPRAIQHQHRLIWTEVAWPHRIIAWEGEVASFQGNEPTRERAEMTGSVRDEYWTHHRVVDEPIRGKLGLSTRSVSTPP